jgi:hypothetical protein
MLRGAINWFRNWWNSPSLLDQFQSICESEDVLELTDAMKLAPAADPFGRFKRKFDAQR